MEKLLLLLFLSIGFAACGGDDIEVYRIAKGDAEASPAAQMPLPMQAPPPSSAPAPKNGAAGLGWTLPQGWTGEGASGMRLATFRYAGTETTVIALAGKAGGDLANANRWRGQIGLGPLSGADFEKESEVAASAAGRVRVIDYTGASKRLLGGMLLVDGRTWFFKTTGTPEAVGKAKPGFLALLKSLRPKP